MIRAALLLALLSGCATAPADKRIVAPVFLTVGFTGSMEPTLRGGEKLFVWKCPFDKVQPGKTLVITWWEGSAQNVVHLAFKWRVEGEVLITKGLANMAPDVHLTTKENFCGCAEILK